MNRCFVIAILLMVFLSNNSKGQDTIKTSKIGIAASIQGSQLEIALPIWVAEKVSLSPVISVNYAQTVATDLGIGLSPKFYFKREKLSPFVGLTAGLLLNIPSSKNSTSTKTTSDFIGGVKFGADYFFDPHFSIGVEAQGNFTLSGKDSDRFGNSGNLNFNTATSVTASIYF
jgi:hypothetical protein